MEAFFLGLQVWLDRWIRWMRVSTPAPGEPCRRFLIVQIDGLSRGVLDRALAGGGMRNTRRLLATGQLERRELSVGLPTSTPAFQASVMYGVRPDIPGFHFYDKREGVTLHFPRHGVADQVERRIAAGRTGILEGGACYGCVFTGGAPDSLWTFARLRQLTRAGSGLRRTALSLLLIGWVTLKCLGLTLVTLARSVGRAAAAAAAGRFRLGRGVEALGLDVAISIWARELFTLLVSADLYRGVPAIYVNFLDYDVFAHAFGPEDRLAFRALRGVDRSIRQLARIVRRLPDLGYDLYVLSDHGQTPSRPFSRVTRGRALEEVVREALGGAGDEVTVIAAGPNAFVYFTGHADPLTAAQIESRHPRALAGLSRHPGIGLVLARGPSGPACWYRGRRALLGRRPDPGARDPFARRADRALVLAGLRDLMAMPSAGDIVLYGTGAPGGDVSFIDELGAHGGPSEAELHTFILHPPSAPLPDGPLTHPVELYAHFLGYRAGAGAPAATRSVVRVAR